MTNSPEFTLKAKTATVIVNDNEHDYDKTASSANLFIKVEGENVYDFVEQIVARTREIAAEQGLLINSLNTNFNNTKYKIKVIEEKTDKKP